MGVKIMSENKLEVMNVENSSKKDSSLDLGRRIAIGIMTGTLVAGLALGGAFLSAEKKEKSIEPNTSISEESTSPAIFEVDDLTL